MRGTLLLLAFCLTFSSLSAQNLINFLSRYETGVFDEGATEIAAYYPDSARVFYTNGDNGSIDVVDISDPFNPILITQIDVSSVGDGANSVAIANGIVAAAIEADDFGQPGKVFFIDAATLDSLGVVEAGVLPDMITFTNDGTKVLVANEGEPNDSATVDPEGSVTIVDISGGVGAALATQIDFQDWNDRKQSLRNRGVRLTLVLQLDGREATVAQDLEPEYITVAPNDSIAYVACQENNALVVVNINQGSVVDILALGDKNYNAGTPMLEEFLLNEIDGWPILGAPLTQEEPVFLGGFSGLWYQAAESTEDSLVFYAIPDRGPNDGPVSAGSAFSWPDSLAQPTSSLRPFKLPDYQGRIVKLAVNTASGSATLLDSIMLTRDSAGTTLPISGKGNVPGFDETPVTEVDSAVFNDTTWVATVDDEVRYFQQLDFDPFGGDFEGILIDKEGNFWMCDEYRPAVYQFDAAGQLVNRFVPEGTSMLGDSSQRAPGFYGTESLPENYSKRWANRGFEAIAYDSSANVVYAFIQSPMFNPDNSTRNNSDVIRILGIDAADGTPVSEYLYLLEKNALGTNGRSRVDKIGDAVYVGNGVFWVLERDSGSPTDEDPSTYKKYVYEINLTGATNMLDSAIARSMSGVTLETLSADQIVDSLGIQPVFKTKVLNLPSIGYIPSDKPEGIAGPLPGGRIAVLNDNDFGIAGAGVSDNSSLGIITFGDDYGIDPSNRDDTIHIRNVPVRSFYMPDAITSIEQGGLTYIMTANEGDAREYIAEDDAGNEFDGFIDEARGEDLMLNPLFFDTATVNAFMDDAQLGRIVVTTVNGDLDGDGLYEIVYGYGARSFSIWDEQGNLVWDSGNDFETITADQFPDDFNSTDNENGSFDDRSDDKGPEPEAIAVGEVDGTPYAFIALERIGGIMAYDITDIKNPVFVEYVNTRNFEADLEANPEEGGDLAPEDIQFVTAEESPVGVPMLIVSYEVSGTIAFFSLGEELTNTGEVAFEDARLKVFPNPVSDQLYTSRLSDYAIFSTVGKLMARFGKTQVLNVSQLPAGTYVISDLIANENRLFIKH